jgi:Tol biopolymer transport system component/tRNA A-37 threonylcarbamoyl transferase component Bud32
MYLPTGTRLGPYEVLAPIGAGGMGEVYKARDTRLDRTVAVKVLSARLADNPRLRQRFEREARALSSLSHPHICTLYDVGQEGGADFLVMEYLEGESLAARLAKGPLAPDELLRIAAQVADALDKAHRQGVIHRDLKPGNIVLTKAGAKLLDFGLAKTATNVVASALSASSTASTQSLDAPESLTAEGTLLGTLPYMAPEQLEGQEADARADIFAFGAVLYEMGTGQRAFSGKSQASLIAAILEHEPPAVSSLQPLTPRGLDRLVKTCLAKDPEQRFQSMHDVRLQLQWLAEAGPETPISGLAKTRRRLAWSAGAATLLLLAWMVLRPAPRQEPEMVGRFQIQPPEQSVFASRVEQHNLALSPDGAHLAFVATRKGQPQLWVRPLDSLEARALAGTEGAGSPFWSPDGRFLAFFADGKLKKISVAGGPAQTLCAINGFDATGSWGPDDSLLFAEFGGRPGIHRVSASGGEPVLVIPTIRAQRGAYRWPRWLPDGEHFLFVGFEAESEGNPPKGFLYTGSVRTGEVTRLLPVASRAEYAANHLLYVRERALVAHPFDARRRRFTGDPVPLAEKLPYFITGWAPFTVSERALAFQAGEAPSELNWYSRKGELLGSVDTPASYHSARLSPEGNRVAAEIRLGEENTDLWIFDLQRGTSTRFTSDPWHESTPVWSPDGRRIIYAVHGAPASGLFEKEVGGMGSGEVVLATGSLPWPGSWSSDGRFLLIDVTSPQTGSDLWVLPLSGDRKPFVFLQTRFHEEQPQLSPNGQWVAYVSDESGRQEIYIRPFQRPGEAVRISRTGGFAPRWRRDGRELFYVSLDGQVYAVPLRSDSVSEGGAPVALFPTFVARSPGHAWHKFDPAPDGQRFLVITGGGPDSLPVTLALRWTSELEK